MSTPKRTLLEGISATDPRSEPGTAGPTTSASDELISILLVDDEPRNLTVLQSVLEDSGYRLVCAESAEQALLALVVEEFALLVIDIQMPGMSGFELAQMIKHARRPRGCPSSFSPPTTAKTGMCSKATAPGRWITFTSQSTRRSSDPRSPSSPSCIARAARGAGKLRPAERSRRAGAEEQLRQLNDELERRVADRTAELVQANTALFESERRLRLALRAGRTGVWDWDLATNRLTWSEESYAIQAVRPGSFEGTIESFEQLVHEADRERVFENLKAAIDRGETYTCEFRIVRPDGSVRWVTNLGVVQFDAAGQPASMTGTITDVTERKCAEEALRDADPREDEFLATLAHELRNPLAPIRTGLHVLGLTQTRPLPSGAGR